MKNIHLKSLLIAQLLLVSNCVFSQTIVWQKSYGTITSVSNLGATNLSDNILITSNTSAGSGNDKSDSSYGNTDLWALKIDESGTVLWDKTFGTSDYEFNGGCYAAKDGSSYLSVVVPIGSSGNLQMPSNGNDDVWLIKLDQQGSVEWQKLLGGSGSEDYALLVEDEEENIIVAVSSMSQISGNRTTALKGMSDVWLIKFSKSGETIWQHAIGGSDFEGIRSITLNSKGNLVLGVISSSPQGTLDKLEPFYGETDMWLVELDTNTRTIISQKSLGGTKREINCILKELSNGNYIVAITSTSPASGNKEQGTYSLDQPGYNHWVLMLDDTFGIVWQKVFGGNVFDFVTNVSINKYGEVFVIGNSTSNFTGNKNVGLKGMGDLWVYKLNDVGEKTNEFGIGGEGMEICAHSFFDSDGLMTFVCQSSFSGIALDRTEPQKGSIDIWVFKLDIETNIATFSLDKDIKLYPNPSKSFLSVEIPENTGMQSMEIYTLQGQLVHTQNINDTQLQVDVSNYAKGTYLVKLTNQQGISISSKVIVN